MSTLITKTRLRLPRHCSVVHFIMYIPWDMGHTTLHLATSSKTLQKYGLVLGLSYLLHCTTNAIKAAWH